MFYMVILMLIGAMKDDQERLNSNVSVCQVDKGSIVLAGFCHPDTSKSHLGKKKKKNLN